jgi:hypothetical protein
MQSVAVSGLVKEKKRNVFGLNRLDYLVPYNNKCIEIVSLDGKDNPHYGLNISRTKNKFYYGLG